MTTKRHIAIVRRAILVGIPSGGFGAIVGSIRGAFFGSVAGEMVGSGKVRRHKCGRRHLLSHKNAKRRRRLRESVIMSGTVARKIKHAIQ